MVLTDFKDTFAVIDQVVDGYNGWSNAVVGLGNTDMVISDRIVVNNDTSNERYAIQTTAANRPTTHKQEVSAGLGTGAATGANQKIGIGCYGAAGPLFFGYRASVDFSAAQRVLSLHRDSLASPVDITMTSLVTTNVTPITGDASVDTGIVQSLRMRVVQRDDGFLIRVYFNNDNMSNPDLEYLDPRDDPMLGLSPATTFGEFFMWTDIGSAAKSLFFT